MLNGRQIAVASCGCGGNCDFLHDLRDCDLCVYNQAKWHSDISEFTVKAIVRTAESLEFKTIPDISSVIIAQSNAAPAMYSRAPDGLFLIMLKELLILPSCSKVSFFLLGTVRHTD